jgi:phosphate transport system substrate-binding protein
MKHHRNRSAFLFLMITFVLAACTGLSGQSSDSAARPVVILKISGSDTITTVLTAIKPAFESATPGYELEVIPGSTTNNGVKGVLGGLLDAAAMSRTPTGEEAAQNIKYYELGLVGQAIIVNPSVKGIVSLNKQQITDIFSGKITNWNTVDSTSQQITLFVREEDDTGMQGLRKTIIGNTAFPSGTKVLFNQADMAFTVEGTTGSIGIAPWPSILATQTNVQAIAIDGIQPDSASYPILGSAGIGYLAERESDIQPLINWLSSVDGRTALTTLGFVSIVP